MTFALPLIHSLQETLPLLARGGGGGSGGGGGGGSGGGGGGAFALIGYLPTHFITNRALKRFSRRVAVIAGVATAVAVSVLAAAGVFELLLTTNDVSGSSHAGISVIILIEIVAGAVVGLYTGLTDVFARMIKRVGQSKQVVQQAASTDPVWQEAAISERVAKVFQMFQEDWSTFNLTRMQQYTSPRFYEHMSLMLYAMYQMKRKNAVDQPQIIKQMIVDAANYDNDDHDNFTAYITARAQDKLIDTTANTIIYQDNSQFQEFWEFDRQGNDWVLQGIRQYTEDAAQLSEAMDSFAQQNGMYYSPDMGWLLLPQRGLLFGKSNFKQSDVNNHVIGNWNNNLVQMYTYIPNKSKSGVQNYLIGQMTLPKSYGGIVVEKRLKYELTLGTKWWGNRDYQKVSMEWPDFNKRYTVHATDMDKVTSFELLNPSFMTFLYDSELPISIEVVDDTVYFYAPVSITYKSVYDTMLTVLARAYKELER